MSFLFAKIVFVTRRRQFHLTYCMNFKFIVSSSDQEPHKSLFSAVFCGKGSDSNPGMEEKFVSAIIIEQNTIIVIVSNFIVHGTRRFTSTLR